MHKKKSSRKSSNSESKILVFCKPQFTKKTSFFQFLNVWKKNPTILIFYWNMSEFSDRYIYYFPLVIWQSKCVSKKANFPTNERFTYISEVFFLNIFGKEKKFLIKNKYIFLIFFHSLIRFSAFWGEIICVCKKKMWKKLDLGGFFSVLIC